MTAGPCIICDKWTPEWGIWLSGCRLYGPANICPACWNGNLALLPPRDRARILKPALEAAHAPVRKTC